MRSLVLCFALTICTSASPAEADPAPELAPVVSLYRDYAWEAVIEEPLDAGVSLLESSAQTLAKYFDPPLVELLLKDRQCQREHEGICKLDFVPHWNSQDPAATQLRIDKGTQPNRVEVSFFYPGNDTATRISYHVVKTEAGWLIANIESGWNLRELLSAPQ